MKTIIQLILMFLVALGAVSCASSSTGSGESSEALPKVTVSCSGSSCI